MTNCSNQQSGSTQFTMLQLRLTCSHSLCKHMVKRFEDLPTSLETLLPTLTGILVNLPSCILGNIASIQVLSKTSAPRRSHLGQHLN